MMEVKVPVRQAGNAFGWCKANLSDLAWGFDFGYDGKEATSVYSFCFEFPEDATLFALKWVTE